MDGQSLNITQDLIAKLKEIIPAAFTEDKLNIDQLKQLLGENINTDHERYHLDWAGKAEAFKVLQSPTTATLLPDADASVDWDNAQSILIEGENLDALKALQKSYYGKVKMIYIDPPYNTGGDSFIYPDKFSETKEEYLRRIGDKDDEGYLMKEGFFRKNNKENGQFHSNWLNMMMPRLFLARNLLRDDGVIFISIDNNEVHNLRLLMNEIFGEENFVECISWNKRIPKNDKGIGNIHEYILLYVKNSINKHEFTVGKEGIEEIDKLLSKLKNQKVSIPESEDEIKKLYKKNGYDRGITLYNSINNEYRLWGKINMSWPNAETFGPTYQVIHPKTGNPVKIPDRGWRWKIDTFSEAANLIEGKYQSVMELPDGSFICGRIWFAKDENTQPSSITYLDEVEKFLLRSILSLKSDGGIEVENLFEGKGFFSYPKPTSLIKLLLNSVQVVKDDIILDFFAGSGTTAQAVMELNEADGGNRKYICIQLPEKTDESSEAYKAGYKSIADITQARIKKVIEKIQAQRGSEMQFEEKQALGFRKFTLAPSNFKLWRGDIATNEAELQTQMDMFATAQKAGAQTQNILWELLLKNGMPLTAAIQKHSLAEDAIIYTADSRLAFVLDKYTAEVQPKLLVLRPQTAIFLDSLFKGQDQAKTNLHLKLEESGITFKTI